jgi:hypothetical protein
MEFYVMEASNYVVVGNITLALRKLDGLSAILLDMQLSSEATSAELRTRARSAMVLASIVADRLAAAADRANLIDKQRVIA